MRSVALYVAWRYIRGSRRQRFASFVALLAMIGITVGVCALIVVSSIMQGLQDRLKQNILSDTAHLVVELDSRSPEIAHSLLSLPHVIAIAPFVQGEAVAQSAQKIAVVHLQAVDTSHIQVLDQEGSVQTLSLNTVPHMVRDIFGSYFDFTEGQYQLAMTLSTQRDLDLAFVDPYNKVRLISTQNARYTPLGVTPLQRNFELKYALQHMDMAATPTIIGAYEDVRRFFRLGDRQYTRLYLTDPFLIDSVVSALPPQVVLSDWRERYGDFFKAVGLEKLTMSIMLCLIVLVAAFNILSSLTMIISSRVQEIAILKTMGLCQRQLLCIFMMVGMFASIVGSILGVLFGIPLALNAQSLLDMLGISIVSGELPVKIESFNIICITVLCFVFSMLCTLYPAYYASRVDPVKNLGR